MLLLDGLLVKALGLEFVFLALFTPYLGEYSRPRKLEVMTMLALKQVLGLMAGEKLAVVLVGMLMTLVMEVSALQAPQLLTLEVVGGHMFEGLQSSQGDHEDVPVETLEPEAGAASSAVMHCLRSELSVEGGCQLLDLVQGHSIFSRSDDLELLRLLALEPGA